MIDTEFLAEGKEGKFGDFVPVRLMKFSLVAHVLPLSYIMFIYSAVV